MSDYKVELRWNLNYIDEPCAICSRPCYPSGEIDSFLAGTLDLVCDLCAAAAQRSEVKVDPNYKGKTVTDDDLLLD